MALSEKQERFCELYVGECCGNGTEAAVRAGYTENRRSAAEIARQNLRKLDIVSRIKDLRREALACSGYDKEKVKELIVRRMVAAVDTSLTDVVHISASSDGPERQAALDAIAAANGGQRVLDFGDVIFVPTVGLTEEAGSAIKRLNYSPASRKFPAKLDVEMMDPIAAAKLLAEVVGLKDADSTVNVSLSPTVILEQVESRREAAHG